MQVLRTTQSALLISDS